MFDGRYDNGPDVGRPVYGAWNRRDDEYGASPRFGSAYLRLRPEVRERATFCWPDSVYDPKVVGGPERLEELCRLADAGIVDPSALPASAANLPLDDPLNDYVEAHVHGQLLIRRDVEAVILDPTDREEHSSALERLDCPVEEHPGYCVTTDEIDPLYRGPVPLQLRACSAMRSPLPGWPRHRGRASTIRRQLSGCGTAWPDSGDSGDFLGFLSIAIRPRSM